MSTIQSKIRETTDGRRTIALTFERESPESDSPVIEAIYQIQMTDTSPYEEFPVLVFLSTTRTDTREPITLTEDERKQVLQMAVNKVCKKR